MDGMDEKTASARATDALFDPEWVLYEVHPRGKSLEKFTLGNMASGAMIATMASKAADVAISRDRKSGSVGGITRNDLHTAARMLYNQNKDVDHSVDLQDFCDNLGEIEAIRKPNQKKVVELSM